MDALVGRLTELGDGTRADRIGAVLIEIGFSGALAPERSSSALARTRELVQAGRTPEAIASVTAIANPADLLTLSIDRRYAALWPRIDEWAGADLSATQARYLEELRADWLAADTIVTATPYARELARLKADRAVATVFLPLFDGIAPGSPQEDMEFLAPTVTRMLDRLGRGDEAKALLAKVAAAIPADDGGNALNIDGAYITLAQGRMDWPQVLERTDAFLASAKALGPSVNRGAVVMVMGIRACALTRSGRIEDAQRAAVEVMLAQSVLPDPALQLHLCRGDVAAARALVIARLADEGTRAWALRFMQPVGADPGAPPFDRTTDPVAQAVRTAPDVIAAATAVGRIRSRPMRDGMPAGLDPFRARTRTLPKGAI